MPTSPHDLRELPVLSPGKAAETTFQLPLLGESAVAQQLRQQVQRIAPYYRRALLIGEPGTGKQPVARQLHALSPVAAGAFIHCSATDLARDNNALESVRRGTLFIDDLGSLSLQVQDGLVRRLQELDRRVRARVAETRLVAASHTDLKTLASTGQFRQDLYSCLSVVELRLMPLRDRLEDLETLAKASFAQSAVVVQLSVGVYDRLRDHAWPRNLSEFHQVLTAAAANAVGKGSSTIELVHLPELNGAAAAAVRSSEPPTVARLEEVMRKHVIEVLARCAGNKLKAAELLGISRSTLYRMLDGA